MQKRNGQFLFHAEKNDECVPYEVFMPKPEWANLRIWITANYKWGNLVTDLGSPVPARSLVKSSLKIRTTEKGEDIRNKNVVSRNRQDILKQLLDELQFDLSYNCFGYCFADGKYFIDNPWPVINEEYEETHDIAEAEKIVLLSNKQDLTTGAYMYYCEHGVNLNPDKTISFKPGIFKLVADVPLSELRQTYNSNREPLLKPRTR